MTQPQGYVLTQDLPTIPAKRYFTIGEVSMLCGVRSYVLRYWEQEFEQLRPMKRRGNRRYYQHHEVLLVRKIRALLYEEGYTIAGARQQLDAKTIDEPAGFELLADNTNELELAGQEGVDTEDTPPPKLEKIQSINTSTKPPQPNQAAHQTWIDELTIARNLLSQ
jgi:DNA-binding transcriptional MerR regulator